MQNATAEALAQLIGQAIADSVRSKSGKASKRKPNKQPVKARAAKKRAACEMKHGPRADFGAPIAGFAAD